MPAAHESKAAQPRSSRRSATAHFQPSLNERDLSHIWEGQRFPPHALRTGTGQPLEVIYRGRPGRGPGPDFRDAVIRSPWGTLRGDVELHVRASDFRRHGHHLDAAYDGLALHLVFWPDDGHDTELAGGRRVPVAALAPWLEGRSREIRAWLRRPALWQEPCRSACARTGKEAVAATLDRLGDIRFRRRRGELRRALDHEEADELLYRALLEALGYGGNREAFRLLALRLPWLELRPVLLALPPEGRAAAALKMMTGASRRPPALAWRTAGVRPGNHPFRRLEAAAQLAGRHAAAGLARGLSQLLEGDTAAAVGALVIKEGRRTLVGPGRAVELLTNAVLPLLSAAGMETRAGRAFDIYRALPRPAKYGPVHHLDQAVGGEVRLDARRQQGMLFLLRNYCTRGRCGSCPLS